MIKGDLLKEALKRVESRLIDAVRDNNDSVTAKSLIRNQLENEGFSESQVNGIVDLYEAAKDQLIKQS